MNDIALPIDVSKDDDLLDGFLALFRAHGAHRYESGAPTGVTQLEHALQCATLATEAGAQEPLVAASFLHDIGHLLWAGDEDLRGIDDHHETCALPLLRRVFPESVIAPISMHVSAKRYLCAVERGYREGLSATSKRTLDLQGGVFSDVEAEAFIARPFARDAVLLRRWDDAAKVVGRETLPFDHIVQVLRTVRSDR